MRLVGLESSLAQARDHLAASIAVVDHLAANPAYKPSAYLERGGRLRCIAARTYLQVFDGMPPSAGVIGRTFRTGRPHLEPDVTACADYLEVNPGVRAEMCAPVRAGGQVVGVVNVESLEPLTEHDAAVLARVAASFGIRLSALGGGLQETPAQRLVRHALRLADVSSRGRVEREVLEAAVDVSGMDSAVMIGEGAEGQLSVVDGIGPLALPLACTPQEALENAVSFTRAGTSCFTVGEAGGQDHSGLRHMRAAGARALALLALSVEPTRVLVVASSAPREIETETIELLELLAAHGASALHVADLVVDLRAKAATDPLTGLGHHRAFNSRLAAAVDQTTAVILIDLDHFKSVNDTHGHAAGDRVLREVAAIMQSSVRDADDVFRIGGDEFAILARAHDAEEAVDIGTRVVEAVREHTSATASVGVCVALPGERLDDALRCADQALYAAKDAGRDRALIHSAQ